jgi:glycosyltransferase involved in cell wall biosynthesis
MYGGIAMKLFVFIKKLLRYGFRFLKLNHIVYKLSKSNIINYSDKMVQESYDFLENYSPNPKSSCICKNKIEPIVDIHIIVPAYNVESYIEECMDSILCNPTTKYTYLLNVINDGSTDKTSEILKKYAGHPCVEIISQANKGFSGARNTGLSHIKGKYVLFVDSDDLMDWRGVEKMMDTALETGADIIRGAYTNISDNGKVRMFVTNTAGRLETTKLGGQPWAKLFRSDIFADVCFPEHYWYEDSIFAQIVFPRISAVYGITENCYYYRNRSTGITKQGLKRPKSVDSFWITERLFEERSKYGLKITDQYYEYVLHMVKLSFSRIRLQPSEVKEHVFILFCNFIDKHFSGFHAHNPQDREIEKIVKTRDIGKCISYAKWM